MVQQSVFAKKQDSQLPNFALLSSDVNALARRVRVLEERYSDVRQKFQLTDQSALQFSKKQVDDARFLNAELSEMKQEIHSIKDTFELFTKELQLLAKREDVAVLQKYLELWSPVKFVTQDEIEGIVERVIARRK
ncbi:hypothetical protein HZB02_06080 [Candidatus Woesearchaeota archaeon]|nr:hypothetical protein [Candidatus Woesearchaeota archaeon]